MDPSKNLAANPSRDCSSQEILSPGGKSRYGRTRRPKISQDFYDIDSVIIDENPRKHQTASPLKSPRLKSPAKAPVIGREILFEIKDEFTKLDDLGMKVANNFKTNLQRGLDDTIKERKFFKSMPENKVEVVPNVVDVTKVFKLISTKSAVISDVYEKKTSPKTTLKTYSNKRKHLHGGDSCVVESFGLPDEPIIPVTSPFSRERDNKIDIDVNVESDVNLPNPWTFDEFQTVPICLSDSMTTMEDLNGSCFNKNNVLDLFSYDSLLSESSEVESASNRNLNSLERSKLDQFQDIPPQKKATNTAKMNESVHKSAKSTQNNEEAKNPVEKPKQVRKQRNVQKFDNVKSVENVKIETKRLLKQSTKSLEVKTITEEKITINQVTECTTSNEVQKNTIESEIFHSTVDKNKNETIKDARKGKKPRAKPKSPKKVEGRRILRSNVDNTESKKEFMTEKELQLKDESSSVIEISDTNSELKDTSSSSNIAKIPETVSDKHDVSVNINQRSLRSNSSIDEPPVLEPEVKINKQVINPVNLSQIICKSQVRVILNPLACIRKLPQNFTDEKALVPNPFKFEKVDLNTSLKQKRTLRSSSKTTAESVTDTVIKIKSKTIKRKDRGRSKKQNLDEVELKEEFIDVKNIKTEIVEYSVGDLTWAKIGTHPYWPCMVTEEPFSGDYKKLLPNRSQPLYHVRFFGDKGRRSWVSSQRIMLYCGADDLDNLAKILKAEDKVKSSFIKEAYVIKPAKRAKWQSGVDEAESLKTKSVDERLNYFFEVFASKREKQQKLLEENSIKEEVVEDMEVDSDSFVNKTKKRLRPSDSDGLEKAKTKKPKTSGAKPAEEDQAQKIINEEIKEEPIEEVAWKEPESPKKPAKKPEESPKKSVAKKVDLEEPEARKRTPKKSTEEAVEESRKRVLRNSQQKEAEEMQLKKLRNEDEAKPKPVEPASKRNSVDNPPAAAESEEAVEVYSPPKLRNKRHVIPCEYSNSDTDSKISDNSSVPASLEAQAALYRRNNIFRGIPKEKVCQICEKPGDVFKCKGPCNGVYHYNCAMSNQTKEDEEVEEKKGGEVVKPEIPENIKSNVEIISVNSKKPLPNLSTSPNFKGMTLAEKIDFRMKEIMKKFDYQSVYSESTDSSSEEFIMDESFDKNETRANKLKNQSKLSLTVTSKPSKKEVPIIKHVTADNINYICVTNEKPKDKVVTELIKDTLKHLRCTWCSSGEIAPCLVCNKDESKLGSKFRQKCSLHQCGKYYHPECLKVWPQTQWSLIQSTKDKKSDATYDTFVCPRHVCHTCISDDPRAANSRCPSDKVVKCLRCPATYHSSNYCVPAGTQILSSSQIVCPRHYSRQKSAKKRKFQQTINTNWCFICSKGGDLICCETCPTSVHVECLPGDQNADDTFFCEDCQSGRLPLYDEIVWVKLGTFRWWPALILFPNEVPDNVRNIAHNKGEFVVKFFGTYDHYWVGRGRTFLFQEGDKGHSHSARKRVDNAFVKAIEEASAAHLLKKQFKGSKMAEKSNAGLKPPPYIRIKVNKPVGNVRLFDGNTSNTTSCDCDPNQPHPCGPDSDCLNRLLLTECNPEVCPAGERCNNQCFEKREYPPLVPHHTQFRGWGLKTLAPIRKGQFVIEYVGEMIDEQEYQRRVQKMHEQKEENYYFLTIDKDRMLDAGPKGNVARFMNHSCQPNCETQKWTVNGDTRVGLFAKCDIPAGTELTFNYNLECIGKEKKICKCGAPNCSGFIGVKVKPEGPPKKAAKPKKKKSPPPPPPEPAAKDIEPCFGCGRTGEVTACNNKICTKYYHLECVGLSSWPEGGKWVCQWHNCNYCSKRTIRCCVRCLNSYCPSHSEGNIRYDKLFGFVCTEHDPTKETNESEAVEAAKDEPDRVSGTEGGAVVTSTPPPPPPPPPPPSEEVTAKPEDEDFLDSLSLKQRLNGWMTSTPLKKNNDDNNSKEECCSQDETSTVSSVSNSETKSKEVLKKNQKKKKKKKSAAKKGEANKVQIRNTANLYNPIQNEVKLSKFTPAKYLRTRKNSTTKSLNRTDPDRDLPIRKRTRLRCGNTL